MSITWGTEFRDSSARNKALAGENLYKSHWSLRSSSREQNGSTKSEYPRASQHDLGWRAQRTTSLLPVAGDLFFLYFPLLITRLPYLWNPSYRNYPPSSPLSA